MRDWQSQPKVAQADLVGDLRALGILAGSDVLVHSSLSRIGHVVGAADAVVDALVEAVGPEGTVLFPTLTGRSSDGPKHPPFVDVRDTPCWTGRIPETARRRPNVPRSLHPTHSISAIGASARDYTTGHENGQSPCDERSPYYQLIDRGGWILLLGAMQTSNTTLHCLEEVAGVPYHLQDEWTDGVVVDVSGERHVVRNRLHVHGWKRDFPKIDAPLRERGVLRIGHVGLAETRLMRASGLADVLLPLLRHDPLYLLASTARESFVS